MKYIRKPWVVSHSKPIHRHSFQYEQDAMIYGESESLKHKDVILYNRCNKKIYKKWYL